MNKLFMLVLLPALLLFLQACTDKKQVQEVLHPNRALNELDNWLGTYVSESYSKREQGYDWLTVEIEKSSGQKASVVIHSRKGLKNPTCSFQSHEAVLRNGKLLVSTTFGNIILSKKGQSLSIDAEGQDSRAALYRFCIEGASLAGTYTRLLNGNKAAQSHDSSSSNR